MAAGLSVAIVEATKLLRTFKVMEEHFYQLKPTLKNNGITKIMRINKKQFTTKTFAKGTSKVCTSRNIKMTMEGGAEMQH